MEVVMKKVQIFVYVGSVKGLSRYFASITEAEWERRKMALKKAA